MLDDHRGAVEGWLDAEPAITAVEVLARLKALHPRHFTHTHLRTVQRAVKVWREQQAKRVIRCGTEALGVVPPAATVAPRPSLGHGDGRGAEALGHVPR